MCTVSWCKRQDGYTLFFNRDESRFRELAKPPAVAVVGNAKCIFPQDPKGGGTWLLVNEHGLTLSLLNYYEAEVQYQPEFPKTRGRLPLELATAKDLVQARTMLQALDLMPYPPLHFLTVDCSGTALLLTWEGNRKAFTSPEWKDLPLSTSSIETTQVVKKRKALFKASVSNASDPVLAMEHFHKSTEPQPAAMAVLMTRQDAKTVSVSRVTVNRDEIEISYQARAGETAKLDYPISKIIPRRRK